MKKEKFVYLALIMVGSLLTFAELFGYMNFNRPIEVVVMREIVQVEEVRVMDEVVVAYWNEPIRSTAFAVTTTTATWCITVNTTTRVIMDGGFIIR